VGRSKLLRNGVRDVSYGADAFWGCLVPAFCIVPIL